MKLRFKITKAGELEAVYSDFVQQLNLGTMQVARASKVEFNPGCQDWEARHLDGSLMAHAKTRQECLEKEKEIVEAELLK